MFGGGMACLISLLMTGIPYYYRYFRWQRNYTGTCSAGYSIAGVLGGVSIIIHNGIIPVNVVIATEQENTPFTLIAKPSASQSLKKRNPGQILLQGCFCSPPFSLWFPSVFPFD
jgi:hypothetical protein